LSSFWAQIQAEVHERAGTEGVFREEAFIQWSADLLEAEGVLPGFTLARYSFEPPNRPSKVLRLDGYHVEVDPEGTTVEVYLVLAHWDAPDGRSAEELPTLRGSHVDTLVAEGVRFFGEARAGRLAANLDPAHAHADLALQIEERGDEIQRVHVIVIAGARVTGASVDDRILDGVEVVVDVWDAERLGRLDAGGRSARQEIVVDLGTFGGRLPCVVTAGLQGRYTAYLTAISAGALSNIYERYGPRLLEANVRSFLQSRNKINRAIRATVKEDPGDFFAFNNGLSAVADSVDIEVTGEQKYIRRIHGLQIVNGAQTTGSIHRAAVHDGSDLSGAYVPVKLTCVENAETFEELIPRISLYANSQNPVRVSDFSSNHPFHVNLETLSRRMWAPPTQETLWYFERARGQYQDEKARVVGYAARKRFNRQKPARQKLTKTDVAKYIHSWERLPHVVSLGAQKNFNRFVEDWIGSPDRANWRADEEWYRELVALAIIFRTTTKLVRQSPLQAYRANVVTYLVALLAERAERFNLRMVWDAQSTSEALGDLLNAWIVPVHDAIVASSSGRNVTEWCKKEACWNHLRDVRLPSSISKAPEVSAEAPVVTPHLVDLTDDRAGALRAAKEKLEGRALKREDAIKELRQLFKVGRLTRAKRKELEGILDDLKRVGFVDSPEREAQNHAIASVRRLVRGGTHDREDLLRGVAREALGKTRLGTRVREDAEELVELARKRVVIQVDGEEVILATPTFESYEPDIIDGRVRAIVRWRGRQYRKADVIEAVIHSLGFVHCRTAMIQGVAQRISEMVKEGILATPSEEIIVRA